ncbi:MAG: ABC transporter ATP-binding protein [Armatimonadetes bacterium]|nr:ABC transporter ATP-binding protein [Candidatus Hippobium faecium]
MDITLKRLIIYISKYKALLAMMFTSSIFLALSNLVSASIVKVFLAGVNPGNDTTDIILTDIMTKIGFIHDKTNQNEIMLAVAVSFMIVYSVRSVFMYFNNYSTGVIGAALATKFRADMYENLQTLSLSYFHKEKTGDFISRMNSDVDKIKSTSDIIISFVEAPVMIILGVIRLFMLNWQLTLCAFIAIPIIGLVLEKTTSALKRYSANQQASIGDVNAKVTENIRGIRIIKSFCMEKEELERFNKVNDRSLALTVKTIKRDSVVTPSMEIVGGIAMGALILAGSFLILSGKLTFPIIGEYIMLAFLVTNSVKSLSKIKSTIEKVKASADRVFEIIDMKSEEKEPENPIKPTSSQGKIEFDHISFSYDKIEPVIDDISFTVNPGETIALVGPSGGGKSTLADLLPRFYDTDKGDIKIDGINVNRYSLKDLRNLISIVPQETILFSGTVRENIAYGKPDATEEEIIQAAKYANALNFIENSPEGFNTYLGETGTGLSGGQRQRIAIARALLRDSKILIMDEATSALDAESESVVQDALDNMPKNKTTIIIAHRLSTVKNADRILVIDRGKLAESGSFEELRQSKGIFSQLYSTQFSLDKE